MKFATFETKIEGEASSNCDDAFISVESSVSAAETNRSEKIKAYEKSSLIGIILLLLKATIQQVGVGVSTTSCRPSVARGCRFGALVRGNK